MTHSFTELKHMTVAQLRDIAKEIEDEAVKGFTQMNKDHLLEAICKSLHIEMHEHHEVVGINKKEIKRKIKNLKKDRDKALEAKDKEQLKNIRKEIKKLKHVLRKATV